MTVQAPSLRSGPDAHGHFGEFGGRYVAETLMPLILDLEKAYRAGLGRATYHGDGRATRGVSGIGPRRS